ncbi:MAG TPA: hypothetical protein VHV08_16720 [Pirellulales bacterium]|nr:hypothetical protein [Pirellulales bacterium]
MATVMWNPGKLVIAAIFIVAMTAAGFSTWFHYHGGQHTRDFWTPKTAVLIVDAPEIKALQLESVASEAEEGDLDSLEAQSSPSVPDVLATKDVAQAPGISNIRNALVQDAVYDWTQTNPSAPPKWQYALEFNDGKLWATVLFDFDSRLVSLSGGKRIAHLLPTVSDDWRHFFAEQFADEPGGDANSPAAGQAAGEPGTDVPAASPAGNNHAPPTGNDHAPPEDGNSPAEPAPVEPPVATPPGARAPVTEASP